MHSSGYFSLNSLYASATVINKCLLWPVSFPTSAQTTTVSCLELVLKCHLVHKNFLLLLQFLDLTMACPLHMALVRVLVALYAGDVIVVLAVLFCSQYHFCCSLPFSCIESIFSCLFNLWSLDSFSLYSSLPIHPFNFAKYFFCLSACDDIVTNCWKQKKKNLFIQGWGNHSVHQGIKPPPPLKNTTPSFLPRAP